MKDYLTEDVQEAIEHMNQDHANTNLLYVKAWGSVKNPKVALMTAIAPNKITFEVTTDANEVFQDSVPIYPPMDSPNRIHSKLISMAGQARVLLGEAVNKKTNVTADKI